MTVLIQELIALKLEITLQQTSESTKRDDEQDLGQGF